MFDFELAKNISWFIDEMSGLTQLLSICRQFDSRGIPDRYFNNFFSSN